MSTQAANARTTVASLRRMKRDGRKIACLTAYDAAFAALLDGAGVDLVLVGDSLGMVVQGHESTVAVTLDDVVYHTACAARGCRQALLVADLPFLSYATPEQALRSAARCLQEGGAQAVKLEGGERQVATVQRLTDNGIPVCAHLGLNPQWVNKLGGYRVQGREEAAAAQMRADARSLQAAGADMLILECVPAELAQTISQDLDIPVIGIGAGRRCDGQILVLHDVLGVTPGGAPRFAHNFLQGRGSAQEAVAAYVQAVRESGFPGDEHTLA